MQRGRDLAQIGINVVCVRSRLLQLSQCHDASCMLATAELTEGPTESVWNQFVLSWRLRYVALTKHTHDVTVSGEPEPRDAQLRLICEHHRIRQACPTQLIQSGLAL
jgi:hypothetical protein